MKTYTQPPLTDWPTKPDDPTKLTWWEIIKAGVHSFFSYFDLNRRYNGPRSR